MAITFRHDASAVALPSTNASGRKYGQQLVLQQQQQKYLGHQAGLDRLFDANKQASQNQFQWRRDQNQNQVQWARDLQRNSDIAARDQVQFDRQQEANRAAEFAQARDRIGMHAQEMLNSGEIPEHLRPEVRELIRGKSIILGSGFDETARKEYLSDYNARLAGILSQIPPKTPPPTPQEMFDRSIVVDPKTGMRYRVDKDGNPEPLAQPEQPQQQPTSFGEWAQQEPDKARKAFADKAAAIQQSIDDGLLTLKNGQTVEDMVFEQLEQPFQAMRKRYGPPTPAPQLPGAVQGAAPSSPMQSILETPTSPAAGMPSAQEQPSQAQTVWDAFNRLIGGGQPADGQQQPAPAGRANVDGIALGPGHPDYKPPAKPTGKFDDKGYAIMDDGSRVDPRDSLAMEGQGGSQSVVRNFHPDGTRKERRSSPSTLLENKSETPQKVKVGGKPLAVTPGTLTPQETAARSQIMEMPIEERIKALMPYDQELKGKTLDQLLNDPKSKAEYKKLTKQGLTTGNYREDMLGHIDEMLQHNVLNAAGQSPPDAYVGMRADEITDPKAKAEVAKLPRPKTRNDRGTIRSGQLYVDPEGVIRSRS